MTRLFFVFICLISGVFSAALKVDELLTKEDTLKVLSTFSYINILKKDPILSFVPLQLPNGSFTDVPLVSDYESSNTDYLNLSLYARYGIYKRVEIFGAVNGFYENTHAQNNVGFHTTSNKGFNEFNLGILIKARR